jgi:hypothetical protein
MARSRLRTSMIAVALVLGGMITTFLISDDDSASAAQPGRQFSIMSGPCWHVGVSDYTCPDSTMAASGYDLITSVSLTVETKGGKKATVKLPPGVDAIFLTRESTEKFLLSYYWATNKEKATALTSKLAKMKDAAPR